MCKEYSFYTQILNIILLNIEYNFKIALTKIEKNIIIYVL